MFLPLFFTRFVWCICLAAMIFTSLDAKALGFSKLTVEMVRDRKTRLSKVESFDDKQEELRFKVKLTNTDVTVAMEKLQVKVWIFGESVLQRDRIKVFSIDEKTLTLPPRKTEEFFTTKVSYIYDNQNAAQYGIKYGGWVILVKDSTGAILEQRASTDRLLKNPDKLDALRLNQFYDRDYNPVNAVY
jgi:murein L,D-transpeptidase YafK